MYINRVVMVTTSSSIVHEKTGGCGLFYLLLFMLSFSSLFADVIDTERFQKAKNHKFENLNKTREDTWKGPFFFIQMADCQLGFMEKNKAWDKEIVLLEKAVERINKLNPRFVVVCGDLVHAWPHKPIPRKEQIHDYKRIMSKIDSHIPLVCVCGNHDVGNIPNRASIEMYESDFGSHYFSFWVGGTQCFAINSALIWDSTGAPDIFAEQEAWLNSQLASSHKPIHKFLFMHHPWFVNTIEDEDAYEAIPKSRRKPYLDLLAKAGFTATFSGHLHYNVLHKYKGMELITTSALGLPLRKDPSGFRVVKVYKSHIEHAYYDVYKSPSTIEFKIIN
jgi:serine/threonine-protein phosphatase CPPED1